MISFPLLFNRPESKSDSQLPIHDELNCYVVFDKLAGNFYCYVNAPNDSLAIREALSTLRVPIRDTNLYCYGHIVRNIPFNKQNIELGSDVVFTPSEFRLVPWSSYKFPETVAESLEELHMSKEDMEQYIQSVNKD